MVSLFGDSCLLLAMGIWVKTLTHSNAAAGLVFFAVAAAGPFAPAAGLLVDRVRRRRILIVVNGCAAGIVLLLLLIRNGGQAWLIYAVMFGYGLAYTVIGPTQSALLTVILPEELLADANGALRTLQESLRLIGPLAGAGLFALVGARPIILIDAGSFLVAILFVLALRVDEQPPHPTLERWRTQLVAGARYLWAAVELRQVVISAACSATVLGFTESVIFAVTADGLHRPPTFVGVLVAVQGAGAVVGGPTAAPLIRRLGEGRLLGLGLVVFAAGATLEIPPTLPCVMVGVILLGVSFPWMVISLVTLVQRLSPQHLQGRVYAASNMAIVTPQTVSIAIGASLIGFVGYQALLGTIAAVTCLAAAYLLSRPEQRAATRAATKESQAEQARHRRQPIRHRDPRPEARAGRRQKRP